MTNDRRANPLEKIPRLIRGEVERVNLPQKMIKVVIRTRVAHPIYGKTATKQTRLNVHWEGEQALSVGDVVDIMETRPISKIKHHVFVRRAS